MILTCPRCQTASPVSANYCRQCGLRLDCDGDAVRGAGTVRHPQPLAVLAGAHAVEGAADLYYTWGALGGHRPLLGTEPLVVSVTNVGYSLANVVLILRATDRSGRAVLETQRELPQLRRGQTIRLDVPSWELHDPLQDLHVTLQQAEFGVE